MQSVSPRARAMLRMRFEEDMTQAEIGAVIGISQMQVSRILRQTVAKLREVSEEAAPEPATRPRRRGRRRAALTAVGA